MSEKGKISQTTYLRDLRDHDLAGAEGIEEPMMPFMPSPIFCKTA